MTNRCMRLVDESIGALLCLLLIPLALVRRALLAKDSGQKSRKGVCGCSSFLVLRSWFSPSSNPPPLHPAILVIKLFGMGSLILATPLLRALRQACPKARITLLTFASNRALAEAFPDVDRVLTLRSDRFTHFAADVFGLLRNRRFDLALDLEFFTFFTALVAFTAAPRRIGFHNWRCGRSLLFTNPVPFTRQRHISLNFLALLAPLGIPPPPAPEPVRPHFPPVDSAALLERLGLRKPFLLINPNASGLSYERRWPLAHFRALMDRVQASRPDLHLAVIGSEKERAYSGKLTLDIADSNRTEPPRIRSLPGGSPDGRDGIGASSRRAVLNLAGQTTLPELAAILPEATALVSNDSGPLHLAALYATPSIALFGPESPDLYRPLNPHLQCLHCGNLACRPCLNPYRAKRTSCRGRNECMQRISPDEVFQALEALLKTGDRA